MRATVLGLCLTLGMNAQGVTPVIDVPTPEGLGYRVDRDRTKEGFSRVTFVHRDNFTRLVVTYSRMGDIETMERYSPGGALLERRVYGESEFVHEVLFPSLDRKTFRMSGDDIVDVELQFVRGGRLQTVSYAIRDSVSRQDPPAGCRPEPPASWESILGNVSSIRLNPVSRNNGLFDIGRNIAIHESCRTDYPRSTERSPVPTLASDIQRALQRGLECMNRMGGQARQDAAAILGYLEPGFGTPVTFRCGGPHSTTPDTTVSSTANAQAQIPPASGSPGVILNTENGEPFQAANRDGTGSAETIFHEMLHLLGYRHGTGFDMPYIASACCFTEPSGVLAALEQEKKDLACELGGMAGGSLSWTTPMYATMFTRMMSLDFRPNVAVYSIWDATGSADRLPNGRHNMHAFFEAGLALARPLSSSSSDVASTRDSGYPFAALIMGYAALGPDPAQSSVPSGQRARLAERLRDDVELRYYDPTQPRRDAKIAFARGMAEILNAARNGENQRVLDLWNGFNASGGPRETGCSALSANERDATNSVGNAAVLTLLRAESPDIPSTIWDRIDKLCN